MSSSSVWVGWYVRRLIFSPEGYSSQLSTRFGSCSDAGRSERISSPTPVVNLGANQVSIDTGYEHTCSLDDRGTAYCWGYGQNGELGNGNLQNSAQPVSVSSTVGFMAITVGNYFACAITESGGVRCWGDNSYGQLGDNSFINASEPVQTLYLYEGVVQVAAGGEHACAVTISGDLLCWGANYRGQLGTGDLIDYGYPVTIMSGVVSVTTGNAHTCAILTDGHAKCWGNNSDGQLGIGVGAPISVTWPTVVQGLANVTAIHAGLDHTCAIVEGTAWCWGHNDDGELGDGSWEDSPIPVEVVFNETVAAMAGGEYHTCLVSFNGDLYCWGGNWYGQLGNGSTVDRAIPGRSPVLTGVTSMGLGSEHSCAIASGQAYCWGAKYSGQTGDPYSTYYAIPIGFLPPGVR